MPNPEYEVAECSKLDNSEMYKIVARNKTNKLARTIVIFFPFPVEIGEDIDGLQLAEYELLRPIMYPTETGLGIVHSRLTVPVIVDHWEVENDHEVTTVFVNGWSIHETGERMVQKMLSEGWKFVDDKNNN